MTEQKKQNVVFYTVIIGTIISVCSIVFVAGIWYQQTRHNTSKIIKVEDAFGKKISKVEDDFVKEIVRVEGRVSTHDKTFISVFKELNSIKDVADDAKDYALNSIRLYEKLDGAIQKQNDDMRCQTDDINEMKISIAEVKKDTEKQNDNWEWFRKLNVKIDN